MVLAPAAPAPPSRPATRPGSTPRAGARVRATDLTCAVRGRRTTRRVTLTVEPGELFAVVGPSGAGKTTLVSTMAGLLAPEGGSVEVTWPGRSARSRAVGFVPQDDIVHLDLPLRTSLLYAAELRLAPGVARPDLAAIVDRTIAGLGLEDRAHVRVGSLSGGQRKRASIATELLAEPGLLVLDEPTSGLDPAAAAQLLTLLAGMAATGTTVVLTTHDPTDIERCDRVAFLDAHGHLAFVGTPAAARRHFGVGNLADAYLQLTTDHPPHAWVEEPTATEHRRWPAPAPEVRRTPAVGPLRQWSTLTRRTASVLVRGRITLAVLIGSPVLVVTMIAMLFRRGAVAAGDPHAGASLLFWMTFAAFFFGLTYGLLQVVGELPILRRERHAGLRVEAYVAAKVTVLVPLLVVVACVMLGALRALGRLPALPVGTWAGTLLTVALISTAALSIGLLASASVGDATQATLALPMICFPQVLFAGSVVPIGEMGGLGRALSTGLANRWGFEALLRLIDIGPAGASAASGTKSLLALLAITTCALLATVAVLRMRARPLRGSRATRFRPALHG
jgi:ABC transport system ATP-binding/permease protein